MDLIRFDHPGVLIRFVPIDETTKEAKKPVPIDDAKPDGPQSKLVSRTQKQISYEHANSQIQILTIEINLATSNIFGQLHDASMKINGLVHKYTSVSEYDFAAERISSFGNFALTELLDTEEPPQWHPETHLLLFVAEFRDNADNSGRPGMTANDQRQFIIIRQPSDKGPEYYKRIGTAKLVNRGASGSFARARCGYTEKNGWMRKTIFLV